MQDTSSEYEIFRSITANEDIANDIEHTFVGIKKLFGDWVTEKLGGLDYNRCYRKNVADVVSGDSRFLNFNYTLTLEKVYGIKQNKVCHIHGKVGDPEEAIYFGHGSDEEIEDAELHWGTELSFNELKRRLRKNTGQAIKMHQDFFKELKDVTEIYSCGFSFSEVDLVYIREICRFVDAAKTTWFLNRYAWENNPEYKKLLEDYGFRVKLENRW